MKDGIGRLGSCGKKKDDGDNVLSVSWVELFVVGSQWVEDDRDMGDDGGDDRLDDAMLLSVSWVELFVVAIVGSQWAEDGRDVKRRRCSRRRLRRTLRGTFIFETT